MSHLHDILSSSPCPDEQELKRYARGELSGDAERKVELHLADCEICSEMVEGYAQLKPEEFDQSMAKLLSEADRKISGKKSALIINFKPRLWAAAAAILLFSGLGFLYKYYTGRVESGEIAYVDQPVEPAGDDLKNITPTESSAIARPDSIADTAASPVLSIIPSENQMMASESEPVAQANKLTATKDELGMENNQAAEEKVKFIARETPVAAEDVKAVNMNDAVTQGGTGEVNYDSKATFKTNEQVETLNSLETVEIASSKSRAKKSAQNTNAPSTAKEEADKDEGMTCSVKLQLAKAFLRNGNEADARKLLKQLKNDGCPSELGRLQIELGNYHKKMNENKKAASYYKDALKSGMDEIRNSAQQALDSLGD